MKLKSVDTNIWFTSDTHYGHKNIVNGVSDWENKSGCRNFSTIEEMNYSIIDTFNKYVYHDDILIHLGDWSFGGYENVEKFHQRLSTNKIAIVIGNHDEQIIKHRCETEHLFSTIRNYIELTIDKIPIVLSHYPMVSWNHSYRGSWMLHGHCHGTLFSNESNTHWYKQSKILDVGIDHAFKLFGEYRPFKFSEIKDIMDKKLFTTVDHHDKETQG